MGEKFYKLSDRKLIYKIYKELIQLNNKKIVKLRNGQKN